MGLPVLPAGGLHEFAEKGVKGDSVSCEGFVSGSGFLDVDFRFVSGRVEDFVGQELGGLEVDLSGGVGVPEGSGLWSGWEGYRHASSAHAFAGLDPPF